MRVFSVALMIALLPLRGWVGDVMAMELTTQSLAVHPHAEASPHAAMPACHEGHAAQAQHHDHAMAVDAMPPASPESGQAAADCGSCSVCQICHSVALAAVLPQLPAAVSSAAAPASGHTLYASAERALGYKPPIF